MFNSTTLFHFLFPVFMNLYKNTKTWLNEHLTEGSDCPQTLSVALFVDYSGILQLKNSIVGLMGFEWPFCLSFAKARFPKLFCELKG